MLANGWRNRQYESRLIVAWVVIVVVHCRVCAFVTVMENLGKDMHHVHAALHYSHTQCGDGGEQNAGGWSPTFPFDFNSTFHTFGVGAGCVCCVATQVQASSSG